MMTRSTDLSPERLLAYTLDAALMRGDVTDVSTIVDDAGVLHVLITAETREHVWQFANERDWPAANASFSPYRHTRTKGLVGGVHVWVSWRQDHPDHPTHWCGCPANRPVTQDGYGQRCTGCGVWA